jgi:hypothetical protein
MKNKMLFVSLFVLLATLFASTIADAQGPKPAPTKAPGSVKSPSANVGTAFTYQGQLKSGGNAVNGTCDFQFGLYDALTGGTQIGATQTNLNVSVSNGLFTTQIDFGANTITGNARWLDIAVRCPASSGSYTTLAPRQALTPAPMALALPGLYTQPTASTPNIIGGNSSNTVDSGVEGATISGGGGNGAINHVTAGYGTIGGGHSNTAGLIATIGGGYYNLASGKNATVGGGAMNKAYGDGTLIGGGGFDGYQFMGNEAHAHASTISGGMGNKVTTEAKYATISGGLGNQATGYAAVVGGGGGFYPIGSPTGMISNTASGNWSVVGGGASNLATGAGAVVPGGNGNVAAGTNSFAAGTQAFANHNGAFVWADAHYTDFKSTAADQFLVRASGGMGIGTNAPAAQLHVSSGGNVANPQLWINQTNTTDYARLRIGVANTNTWDIAAGPGTDNVMNFFRNGTGNVMSLKPDDATNYLVMGNGARLTKGGVWTNASDRNLKTNFETVDSRAVLAQVVNMPITVWNYKVEATNIRHLGPMAQDFYAAFKLGDDDKTISTLDLDGVALSSIQGLYEIVTAQDAQIAAQQKKMADLESRLTALEQLAQNNPGSANTQTNLMVLGIGALLGVMLVKRPWGDKA